MSDWYMVTLVGKDRPNIVADVSMALYKVGGNLGEASMARLGGNFTIMLMVQFLDQTEELKNCIQPVGDKLGLHVHVDQIEGNLHRRLEPNIRISVYGADQPGIIAHVTDCLAKERFNVIHLESDVAGTAKSPIYIMHLEGQTDQSTEAIKAKLSVVGKAKNVEIQVSPIEMLMG